MKRKVFNYTTALMKMSIVKAAMAILFLFALQGVCLGQAYSYTDVGVVGASVSGYGAVSGYYNSGSHVTSTSITLTSPSGSSVTGYGGESASASIAINSEEGNFSASTSHVGTCPYSGSSHTIGGSGGQTQVCTDTCTGCQAQRESQGNTCLRILITCQGAATAAYVNAINSCENQSFCQSDNPNYNLEECNRCKNTALDAYLIASSACGGAYTICMLNRVDCELSIYKKPDCSACTNP